ncbi:hypothetical protein TorRG33x02_231020 [Trema orientale]|uniref:Putative plant transposon protein domain-containing protein n=1 Tax=Trema orientale TaxID=63057 RepID=A0A2P5E6I0_TREOI|nr:hypothetical protein TorRG33x02_231020 [Trema orientale]
MVFPANALNPYGKVWFYFICSNLIPSKHVTEVTTDRAALLFCIVIERLIDVSKVIKRPSSPSQRLSILHGLLSYWHKTLGLWLQPLSLAYR